MALTDVAIRNAKPGAKAIKLADGGGMFLLITPAGGKLWRLKYRVDGREKLLAIGPYPEIGLGEARRRREEARELIALGKDPSREKQRDKVRARIQAADTFKAICDEYCQKRRRDGAKGWAPATATRSEYLLSLVCGSIGKLSIAEIEPADVLTAIRRIEGKGKLESARRSLQLAGAVFRYAVATARLASDPTRDLRGALTAPTVTHYGAITDAKKAGELLRAIDDYDGSGITKLALQISPHVFVRPGELRHAEWNEFDLDGALWIIPAGKMKSRKTHHVPLSRQAVELFREVQAVTGLTGYVFPSVRTRTRPMSENTINAGLRRLGYLKEAQRRDEGSIDAVAKALARFEEANGHKDFKTFHRAQAVAFKHKLDKQTAVRTGKPLSRATVNSTLSALRAFFVWLAGQPGYKSRLDNIWEHSTIIQDVFGLIWKSSVVLCDFSGRNPNVFYECGIAHTLGRHVIPLAQHKSDVPFDLQHHRYLSYLPNDAGLAVLADELSKRLRTISAQS